jgi:DNA-binding CsgD family transcriptional regulator
MRTPQPFRGSPTADISSAVLAIGRRSFSQALLDTLRRIANVGHCMVFTFEGERCSRCILDIGNIPTGPELGVAYSEHFHLADPNREAVFRERTNASPIVLPTFARHAYSERYLKMFFYGADIVDKFATAIWVADTCFYVNFYRTTVQGRYGREQIECLKGIAPAVCAAVARHFQEEVPPNYDDPLQKVEALFSASGPLWRLSSREKDVCLRILSGCSSEAISIDLGISLQSTYTYRKRAYEKLDICSQNELFGIVLRLLASPCRPN